MKVTVPEKEIEVCDICQREGYLQTCIFCKGKFCLTCNGMIAGCIHTVQICRKCENNPVLIETVMAYAPRIKEILNERAAEIIELGDMQARAED